MHLPSHSRRTATSGVPRGARRRPRARYAPLLGALAAASLLFAPSLAHADSSSSLTVIGTSDVSDSGLIPNLIQPGFSAAYPQYTFKYIGTASGAAITQAENGAVGASVLIVHAPSLENQFVAGGYSLEPYGRAIWTNDFVLAGPQADPAGVGANAAHNIAQAFVDVATAGAAAGGPNAIFVSRGGTPGTTVSEHGIWGLVYNDGLTPAGVDLCQVPSAGLGGGYTPIAPGAGVTNGEPCPGGVLPGAAGGGALPAWYKATGVTQGPNVVDANACTAAPVSSATNDCYVYTDRGTYDYLLSGGTAAGGPNEVPNLSILTRNNSASAPGGATELENYFHAYIINPAKSPSPVNVPAAQAFINYITSPAVQGSLSSYLQYTGDPGGPPFVADASPGITFGGLPSTALAAGTPTTVYGQLTNEQPNFAVPANQTVTIDRIVGGVPVPVASGTTNAAGIYNITFTPPASGTYQASTGLISLIENASLNPVYGDELSPGASSTASVSVQGAATLSRTTTSTGSVSASGSLLPVAPDANGTATLLARPQSSSGAFKVIGSQALPQGQGTYAVNGALTGGKWTVEVQYADAGSLLTATTATKNVTVANNSVAVSYRKLSVKKGRLVLSGKLNQGPIGSRAKVRLLALAVGRISTSTSSKKTTKKKSAVRIVADAKKGPQFRQVAKATVKEGRTTYTIKHTFKRGYRYVLQLQYVHKGQPSTYSTYKYIDVR